MNNNSDEIFKTRIQYQISKLWYQANSTKQAQYTKEVLKKQGVMINGNNQSAMTIVFESLNRWRLF